MTINKILVANRGEIARRVFATCRRLGIGTVAVYSDADSSLSFVGEADLAVRLPGNTPAETYLRADLLIEAARKAGADAIHPGYGFLSENAAFARAVTEAGLTWIGPTAESIEAMGSKVAAKKLMAEAGVPVFAELDPAAVTEADLPLLVKASAGGGGRGMRIVRSLDRLAEQVALASAEAESAFGDPTVFCEPYLEHGRHVEVQVIGDVHGQVLVLGDRDCSIQRRHQKVVEEAPAPNLPFHVREQLHEGARLAAESIAYVGAGTVEFMVSGDRVSFLEMNTRLQVEHPVTEAVFGVDLVEQQIRVAEGHSCLPERGGRRAGTQEPAGHAVEVRLYAEDPASDYRPQSGRLDTFDVPHDVAFAALPGHGIRLDTGFESGDEVGTHYDAMLAKVVSWGPDRDSAFRALAGVLERARLHGLVTNRDLLVRLLRDERVLAGAVSTDLLDGYDLAAAASQPGFDPAVAAAAAALALAERDRVARTVQQGIPVAWRNVVSQPQRTTLATPTGEVVVEWYGGRNGYLLDEHTRVVETAPDRVVLEVDGVMVRHDILVVGDTVHVDSGVGSASYRVVPRFVDPAEHVSAGSLLAPMPGTVIAIQAEPGATVEPGQALLVLEAMKMQHTISAPAAGVLEVAVQVGQQVSAGDVLAVVTSEEEGAEA